ncbi:MAG: DEAD/DEAH box helicase [Halobacteria archaeon]|nr:DEAD/DEAH box helicase [Halobacteria archaeon]
MSESGTADVESDYIDHPLLNDSTVERRMYQLELSSAALSSPSLVVLPTGTGKTSVSLLVTAARLNRLGGKSLLLAPTKPLVEQHAEFFREALEVPDSEIVVFTGDTPPDERSDVWEDARVVIATPQVIENDIIGSRIDLSDVVHLTFDECHRATGDYSYVYIAESYARDAKSPLVTGMTASPGSNKEEILEVCDNLGIENVEIMTEEDSDLSEYTHDTDVEWKHVDVPDEILELRDLIEDVVKDRMERLKSLGVINTARTDISMNKLLSARGEIQEMIDNDESAGYSAMSIHAEVMKLRHAVEIVETQGVDTLVSYFEKLENEARSSGGSKAVKRLMSEDRIQEARRRVEEYDGLHPKMEVLRPYVVDVLSGDDPSRVIVFTEYRDTAATLTDFFESHDGIEPQRFVGQSNRDGDPGMTQKDQKEAIEGFKSGESNVLVATSVAEEGIDIPEVDLVLFYEPVPSEIRSIQRRGRTGRQRQGNVVVLIAEDTRDEAYFWSAKRKEKKMKSEMEDLKGVADEINDEIGDNQRTLGEFDEKEDDAAETETTRTDSGVQTDTEEDDSIVVVADQRETKSNVVKEIDRSDDVDVRLETLDVGDYVASSRVGVERKTTDDFVSSITGERSVFEQVKNLSSNYSSPMMVVEGTPEDLYSKGVHPNAVRGALTSISIDFGVSVVFSRGDEDTAELLMAAARREQTENDTEVQLHDDKSSATVSEQQEYVVSSIADVGRVIARNLLEEFGTVENVMTASVEDLKQVDKVGEKTARRIREILTEEY